MKTSTSPAAPSSGQASRDVSASDGVFGLRNHNVGTQIVQRFLSSRLCEQTITWSSPVRYVELTYNDATDVLGTTDAFGPPGLDVLRLLTCHVTAELTLADAKAWKQT